MRPNFLILAIIGTSASAQQFQLPAAVGETLPSPLRSVIEKEIAPLFPRPVGGFSYTVTRKLKFADVSYSIDRECKPTSGGFTLCTSAIVSQNNIVDGQQETLLSKSTDLMAGFIPIASSEFLEDGKAGMNSAIQNIATQSSEKAPIGNVSYTITSRYINRRGNERKDESSPQCKNLGKIPVNFHGISTAELIRCEFQISSGLFSQYFFYFSNIGMMIPGGIVDQKYDSLAEEKVTSFKWLK